MTVRSTPPTQDEGRSHVSLGTPIPRQHLDTTRKPARVLFGAIFVAYSSIGTILGVHADLKPALARRSDGDILGYGIGALAAFIIFAAELYLAEVSTFWYIVVLIPDTWYTYRLSGWIEPIVTSYVADPVWAMAVTVLATGLFSLAVAYMGERLLFGRRRR